MLRVSSKSEWLRTSCCGICQCPIKQLQILTCDRTYWHSVSVAKEVSVHQNYERAFQMWPCNHVGICTYSLFSESLHQRHQFQCQWHFEQCGHFDFVSISTRYFTNPRKNLKSSVTIFACQQWTVIVCARKTVLRAVYHEDAIMSLLHMLHCCIIQHPLITLRQIIWTFFFL